ncbi:MAG: putative phosphotransacetylase [Gammaproteobacteria bacterium]|jgi:propanediol utilization protein|nr:putative phosphotransacetylase [Gammaproteobacteria bacterium]
MNTSLQDEQTSSQARIPVAVSERHVHLTQTSIEQLFCDKYQLHEHARVSQPTEFAARETVTLVGPRGRIANVRVIGPAREENQVEISQTDALALGVGAPLRESGDTKDSPGIVVEGPRACVRLEHGVIRTLRHIHLATAEAARHGLKDRDRIDVTKEGAHPRTLFCDVLVRVSSACRSELHLDPDESDAAGLHKGAYVAIKRKP